MAIPVRLPKIPSLDVLLRGLLKKRVGRIRFRSVALFVGKEFVDLAVTRRTFSGPRLVNFVSVPIHVKTKIPLEASTEVPPEVVQEASPLQVPQGPTQSTPMEEENLSTHEKILSALRRAIRETGLRGRRIVSTLSEEEVIVRYFQMPPLPRKDWDQAIRFEARKYIPFALDELISDFSVMEGKKEKGKMDVVFVAAKKETIARHLALLTKADLEASHLETLPFSFMRLLYALEPQVKKEKCICVADVDGLSCSIILIREKLPYLVRRISLEPSMEESLPSAEPPQEGKEALSGHVAKLLDELRLTLRYYQNQFPGESINRMILFGDELKRDVPELLAQELNLPVSIGDLSQMIGSRVPSRLAKTIGLGLWGLIGEDSEIELLPKKAPVATQQTRLFRISAWEGLGAAIALLILSFVLSHNVTVRKSLLERERTRRPIVTTLSKEALKEKRAALAEKASLYNRLFEKEVFWTKKLSQLGKLLPEGAWVTSLAVEDRSDEDPFYKETTPYSLVLRGYAYAPDRSEALKIPSQFLEAIRENRDFFEGFTEAKLVSVKRDKVEAVEVVSFEIRLIGER